MAFVAPNREAGRILYQGMMDQARGIAGAVNQFVDEGYKRQEQDKEFNAKLKVTEQALGTFIKPKAAEFGTTPEAIDAFLKVNPNESPKERYLRLGGFLEQAITSSKMTRDMQQADTQRKYTDALAASAMAQKQAQDAATADRLRETKMAEQFVKGVTELDRFNRMEQEDAPFTIEEAERYDLLKNNPLLKEASQAVALGMNPGDFFKMRQGERALNIQERDVTNRGAVATLQAENERLKALIQAGKPQPSLVAGTMDTATLPNGVEIKTVWTGREYVDAQTKMPVNVTVSTIDKAGNQIRETRLNPQLIERYNTPPAPKPKTPAGGKEEVNPEDMEEVTQTPSKPRTSPSIQFLMQNSPRFNTAEELQAAVNNDPTLVGKIVIVGGQAVRVRAAQESRTPSLDSDPLLNL